MLHTAFQACASVLLDIEAPAHFSLCTTFREEFSLQQLEFDGAGSTQLVVSFLSVLWQARQLPLHCASMSNQVLQRGQCIPVLCPDDGARGQLHWGQTRRFCSISFLALAFQIAVRNFDEISQLSAYSNLQLILRNNYRTARNIFLNLYSRPLTNAETQRLVGYIVADGFFDGQPLTIFSFT